MPPAWEEEASAPRPVCSAHVLTDLPVSRFRRARPRPSASATRACLELQTPKWRTLLRELKPTRGFQDGRNAHIYTARNNPGSLRNRHKFTTCLKSSTATYPIRSKPKLQVDTSGIAMRLRRILRLVCLLNFGPPLFWWWKAVEIKHSSRF